MVKPRFRPLVLLLLGLLASSLFAAENAATPRPFVSPIFGDNMVLQREKPNTFWGWAAPGEEVKVTIGERRERGRAGADGRWEVKVQPPAVGTRCTVEISGSQQVTLKNVIVGDVWLCSGQSNMQWGLPNSRHGADEVAAADHPNLRFFVVGTRSAYEPMEVLQGSWKVCTPQTAGEQGGVSAVAYFFARRVQAETGVPIGLVQSALGGTPVECWMSPSAVERTGQFGPPLAEIAKLRGKGGPVYGSYIMHWYDEFDPGVQGKTWADPELNDTDWKPVDLPGAFAAFDLADVPAVVWLRKEITLPDPLPKGVATVRLGVVEKMETTYVNGRFVGASSWVENPRAYRVPADGLKPGRNVIALRVFKLKSKAAFLTAPADLKLTFADGPEIPLAQDWRAKVAVDAREPHPLPLGFENYPIMPTVLYQGMIHPLVPLALKGALWYQGEANSSRAHQYRTLLPGMIADWRAAFGQGDFPFLIAQLPNFQKRKTTPGSDDWAELREAQAHTARTVPKTAVAVTIDVGDPNDIHPRNKQPVGERLALLALTGTYGKKDEIDRGPTYARMEKAGSAIRIHFDHTDGGLMVRGDQPEEFSIAGADRQWRWATARIEGDTVIVSSPEVPEPVAVRYAWQANPAATLFNGAGLPAAPFRTDDWPGVTDKAPAW